MSIRRPSPAPASPADIIEISPGGPGAPGAAALERGAILRFTQPAFTLDEAERTLIAEGVLAHGSGAGTAKNISYDGNTGMLKGTAAAAADRVILSGLMARYARFAETLVRNIAPEYGPGITCGRTSFRAVEIATRKTSWRKDDRRRHVDAFPSNPTGGARILRVFLNVDQAGQPRHWRIGPDFESFARNFLPRTAAYWPGLARLQALLGITKARRTGYDHLMLGLHDAAKRDLAWQENTPAQDVIFMPGEVWMGFTDQVPHAALSGRNALEQSFYIDPAMLASPAQSPLGVLTRLTGRDLTRPLL